ncbi:MAG: F0F1 ATP synthase subunit B [Bacteroidales bacterium]|nr:F0F1 ATP synthase subunit B [Bacteroidales bacterium]MCF8345468.1 F0F1 ATP synthase subunit B [Bacteroidales bacterium]MCF8350096.1 F0F1 ATP synthase subunit B [Bacteroidales bacterium]MCF8376154.1 F0F1 ATP synthase subunit B [Bacteroidales bacterium]
MELVSPGIGLIFWMTLSFAILIWILGKFAWKPIMKSLKEREDSIDEALHAADKAREEMKQLKFSNEKLLAEAKDERDAILRDARKVRDKIIDEAREKANQEANRIVENAKGRIENEKMAAMTDLKNQLASLSIEIAEKVLKQELSDEKKQKDYVQKLIDEINFN